MTDAYNVTSVTSMQSMEQYETDPGRRAIQTRDFLLSFQHAISATERCPIPVIAAIHGAAIGLAVDIATACDIRYAASNSSFSVKVLPFTYL